MTHGSFDHVHNPNLDAAATAAVTGSLGRAAEAATTEATGATADAASAILAQMAICSAATATAGRAAAPTGTTTSAEHPSSSSSSGHSVGSMYRYMCVVNRLGAMLAHVRHPSHVREPVDEARFEGIARVGPAVHTNAILLVTQTRLVLRVQITLDGY